MLRPTITRLACVAFVLSGPAHALPPSVTAPITDITGRTITPPNGAKTPIEQLVDPVLGLTARRGKGSRMQLLGDSRACNGNTYGSVGSFIGYTKGLQNPLTWAEIYSNGVLSLDQTVAPPAATSNTIVDLKVLNGGSNYTAPTIAIPLASGFVATANVVNGKIVSVTVTNPGNSPSASVTKSSITVSDPTGSGAVLTPVLGGMGSFCAGGTQLDEINARLDDVIAQKYGPKPDFLIVVGGTNGFANVVAGTETLRYQLGIAMTIIKRATAAGMHVVWLAENPKSYIAYGASSTATQNAALVNESFNHGLRLMAAGDPSLNPQQVPFELVDASRYQADASNGNGNNRIYTTVDNLHWSAWGAQQEGWLIEQALRPYYQVALSPTYSPLQYSAAFNPLGNLVPTFTGTDGTITAPTTGQAPHGWITGGTNGSGTGSFGLALTYPTAQAPDSKGLVIPSWTWTVNANADGVATGNIYAQYPVNVANLSAGDRIRWSCDVAASGLKNITYVDVQLSAQSFLAHYGQAGGTYIAPSTDQQVGTLPPAGAVVPSRMKVEALVTAADITANTVRVKMVVGFDASAAPNSSAFGGGTGATATVTWRNCQLTKVGASLIQ